MHMLVLAPSLAAAADVAPLVDGGFELSLARSLGDAVRQVVTGSPDGVLVVADDDSALSSCEVLSALGSPPLVLAGREISTQVATACLGKGADATIHLPMPLPELAARLRAVQRRVAGQAPSKDVFRTVSGDLVIDHATHSVTWRGAPVELSPTEFKILAILAEHPNRVVTNAEILTRAWGEEYINETHYLRIYIGYLRAKLEADRRHPRVIVNQWGVGYRLLTMEPAQVS
jgi:two-component system KDP operon response regulator KdpE